MVQNAVAIPAGAIAEAQGEVAGMFEQAQRVLGDSLKMATKAQKETVTFWSEAADQVNPMPALAGQWILAAEDCLRLLDASYRRNAEVLRKVMRTQTGAIGLESRTGACLEASLETARDNVQDLASTQLRVAQAWAQVFQTGHRQAARFSEETARFTEHSMQLSMRPGWQSKPRHKRLASGGGRGKAKARG